MRLLTVAEVARRLRCSPGYVRKLIAGAVRGMPRLRAVRLHRWLVYQRDLTDWLTCLEALPARDIQHGRNGHGRG